MMSPEQPPVDLYEGLLEAVGDHPLMFQDLLSAGYDLGQVEEISDRMMAFVEEGSGGMTLNQLRALRDDPYFAEVLERATPYALGRIRKQFY